MFQAGSRGYFIRVAGHHLITTPPHLVVVPGVSQAEGGFCESYLLCAYIYGYIVLESTDTTPAVSIRPSRQVGFLLYIYAQDAAVS